MPDSKEAKEENEHTAPDPKGEKSDDPKPLAFDSWLNEQPDEVKTMLTDQTAGLKSALESERTSSKKFEKELRTLAETAEGDVKAALETKADEISQAVDAADRKTDFYEAAHSAGITNLKLAFHVATTEEMFDRKGNVNFETMKAGFPELFGGKPNTTKGNAGSGLNTENVQPVDMNALIRQKSGRLN